MPPSTVARSAGEGTGRLGSGFRVSMLLLHHPQTVCCARLVGWQFANANAKDLTRATPMLQVAVLSAKWRWLFFLAMFEGRRFAEFLDSGFYLQLIDVRQMF